MVSVVEKMNLNFGLRLAVVWALFFLLFNQGDYHLIEGLNLSTSPFTSRERQSGGKQPGGKQSGGKQPGGKPPGGKEPG